MLAIGLASLTMGLLTIATGLPGYGLAWLLISACALYGVKP